jgi:hypothetical protein
VTEVFATSNQPQQEDSIHERLQIEEESGKIWQEGCGDIRESDNAAGGIFLNLVGWEREFQTWERANRRWIERWRGNEASLGRSPAPRLDARLAPTQRCTPGEFPTSTPTPSPSPTPSPTPAFTPQPSIEPTPTPVPGPPTPTPTPAP